MHKAAPSNCLTLVSCMEILSLTCLLRTADSGEQSSHLDLPHYASLLHTCHVIARRIDGMSPTSRGRWSSDCEEDVWTGLIVSTDPAGHVLSVFVGGPPIITGPHAAQLSLLTRQFSAHRANSVRCWKIFCNVQNRELNSAADNYRQTTR